MFFGSPSAAPLVHYQSHTLSNGLKIIILPSGVFPIVTIGMLVHVGTADDPVSEVGLSHFLEHMMFKGTKKIPGGLFKRKILQNGGETNALTDYDYTLYYTTIAADKLELLLELEADRLRDLAFTHEEVESEKKVVMEERGMRIDNNPMGILYERYVQARNPYHPYGTLPIGFPHHIQAYTFESARAHYDRWYHPNNTTLIIAGDITLEKALPLIEKHFGHLPRHAIPNRQRPQNPGREGITQNLVQYNKRNAITLLLWSYDAPHFHSADKKTYYALCVLQYLLGGDNTGSFAKYFVEEKKLAVEVSSHYDGDSLDPQDFSLTAVLMPGVTVNTVKGEMKNYLQKIMVNGVVSDELERAKHNQLSPLYTYKDGTDEYLFNVAQSLGNGISIEAINAYAEGIQGVTLDDLKKAAQLVFDQAPAVVAEMHPASS